MLFSLGPPPGGGSPRRTMASLWPEKEAGSWTESDPIVAETAARIFADLADPQTVNRAGDTPWKEGLWRALADAGLTLAWTPEKLGGAGASLTDGCAVLGA